jgi:ureidoacrylate peracid hydrolase
MHQIDIPEAVVRRAIDRRGSRHVFPTIEPQKTALLVIDLQSVYVAEGASAAIATAREIVQPINRLAASLRRAGGRVVWIKDTRDDPARPNGWPRFHQFAASLWGEELIRALSPGQPGHELYSELDVSPNDEIAFKTRFSAFAQDASDLHEKLQQKGIDTLIITGAATNVCCESTARDAMMLNYKVHFVADATACNSDAEHNATLANMLLWFADVRMTDELIALIDRDAP